MANNNSILTSIYGKRLGLQSYSSGQSGGSKGAQEFLVGPDDIRVGVTTNESTGTPMNAGGVSYLVGTSVASTPVFQLAPPIPGVRKVIFFGSTDSAIYVKASAATHAIAGTSLGATSCGAIRSSGGGAIELIGLSTSLYGVMNISSSAVNALEFQATT
jgi:hypothetical protein